MRPTLFVDTSALWAFFDAGDQFHLAASECFEDLFDRPFPLLTTDYIVDEVLTGLRMRAGHRNAVLAGTSILNNRKFLVRRTDNDLWQSAWDLFRTRDRLKLSFTDCVSYACMQAERVGEIFTFDHDFVALGCRVRP